MSAENIESLFPGLREGNYDISSPEDDIYNCVAWASGDTTQWWEPVHISGYYWPPEANRDGRLESWIQVFILQGYEISDNGDLEEGFEKVAIYVDQDGEAKHVARQLPSGNWTSKLGGLEDIEHDSLRILEGERYQIARCYLRRPRRTGSSPHT